MQFTGTLRKSMVMVLWLTCWVGAAWGQVRNAHSLTSTVETKTGYAVQVSVVDSQVEADFHVTRLQQRGLAAYWIRAASDKPVFGVRAGNKFANQKQANAFGMQLVHAGSARVFEIVPYEAPAKASAPAAAAASPKAMQSAIPEALKAVSNNDEIAVSQSWPAPRSIAEHQQEITTATVLQVANARAIDRQAANQLPVPETAVPGLAVGTIAPATAAPAMTPLVANVPAAAPALNVAPVFEKAATLAEVSSPKSSNSVAVESTLPSGAPQPTKPANVLAVQSAADRAAVPVRPLQLVVEGVTGHSIAPQPKKFANQGTDVTTAPAGAAVTPTVLVQEVDLDDLREFDATPLESKVEPRDGRLLLHLFNRNARHPYRGVVKLTLQDKGKEDTIEPWQFLLKPNEESTFDLNAAVAQSGNYWVRVYGENGAMLMMKAASLAPKPKVTAPPPVEPKLAVAFPVLKPETQGVDEEELRVNAAKNDLRTGEYPGGQAQVKAEEEGVEPAAKDDVKPVDGDPASRENLNPADIKIVTALVASSTESVTLEFEILAPQPLGMISLTLQTASANDFKQAIMTGKQGRIPFLVPIADTNGAFRFELKDESGRVLTMGQKTFLELKKP